MNGDARSAGFTLIEVLLSVGILALITGMATPVYIAFTQRNDLSIASQTIAAMLYRAEAYSRGAYYDTNWSVDFSNATNTVTLYAGTTFASRDTTKDETYSIPDSLSESYTGDVSFTKLTGLPTSPPVPTITLTSNNNDSGAITVNAKGVVDY